jgi:C_GCAxxG_C_C family probable redox protein
MGEIDKKFDEALKQFEEMFPKINPAEGGCAEATLTGILNILGIQDGLINNIMIPLSGGLGGYKSEKGLYAPCGAVVGGCAAVGVILGGKGRKKMATDLVPVAYMKSAQFAKEFEQEFGSIYCPDLSGYDFSQGMDVLMKYIEEGVWGKKCCKYVLWAINHIRNVMTEELDKW